MEQIGRVDDGPIWGNVRPIRSDEWAVVTPLTQATVNNGYQRYNRTSLYGEDLRINYGLPIRDWGFAFKPTMWLYGFANPAYAYSFHWFAIGALFLIGYAWLFLWLGADPALAFILSGGLYYTGFTQFWWNEKGPILAMFPWLLLPFATRLPLWLAAGLFYWAAVTWLLTNFYPPVQISLAFVGFVLLLALKPNLFRPKPFAVLLAATTLAAVTAAWYLWDYLQATSTTIYPGQRHVAGGAVRARYWLSWLLPATNFDLRYESLIGKNICEIGTVGLYYTLASICFLDFRRWREVIADREGLRKLIVLATGLMLMFAWMALPLPWWVGSPLLWHHVQPERMQFAAGVLLIVLLFALVRSMGLRLSWPRIGLFAASVLAGWWTWKRAPGQIRFEDLVILPAIIMAFLVGRRWPSTAHLAVAAASLLEGTLLFGRFNPLQPAWPIFNRVPTPVTDALDYLASENRGILAIAGFQGAAANGLGYRSLSHLTAVPQLAFWRQYFPELPEDEFNHIFNRYAHITPTATLRPRLTHADAVSVPLGRILETAPVRYIDATPDYRGTRGSIDTAIWKEGALKLVGRAAWEGPLCEHELEVVIEPPASGPAMRGVNLRSDLPIMERASAVLNGFSLQIPLSDIPLPPAVCVLARESSGKRMLLKNPAYLPYCKALHSEQGGGS